MKWFWYILAVSQFGDGNLEPARMSALVFIIQVNARVLSTGGK